MTERGYIMLSYNWAHKVIVRNIRYRLWQEGYRVWIDIDEKDGMKDFIYSDMPNAVKHATVVISCLSKKYEDSPNCKTEGGCIGHYNKKRIPLLMEKDYKLDDWVLGIFVGRIWIDFSNVERFEANFQELLARLQNYPTLNPEKNNRIPANLPLPEPLSSNTNPIPPSTSSDPPDTAPPVDTTDNPRSLGSEISGNLEERTTSRPTRPSYKLTEREYASLLVKVSQRWKKFGNVHMLKVLLCDFNKIGITEIQKNNDEFELFKLLRGSGKLSPSNIDVIVEAAFLCGVGAIEEVILDKIPEYQYPTSNKEINTITKYRQNVIEFGIIVNQSNLEEIVKLSSLPCKKEADKWSLIFELELHNVLTPKNKESFIEMLGDLENDTTKEVDALNTYK
ncbi:uncharacterized protein [Antedon mediterranea]|uniref:uncharacterized protein n=1 Tax=Antedon mediterranea TaxID=105859 RepID=UPI003AF9BA02